VEEAVPGGLKTMVLLDLCTSERRRFLPRPQESSTSPIAPDRSAVAALFAGRGWSPAELWLQRRSGRTGRMIGRVLVDESAASAWTERSVGCRKPMRFSCRAWKKGPASEPQTWLQVVDLQTGSVEMFATGTLTAPAVWDAATRAIYYSETVSPDRSNICRLDIGTGRTAVLASGNNLYLAALDGLANRPRLFLRRGRAGPVRPGPIGKEASFLRNRSQAG